MLGLLLLVFSFISSQENVASQSSSGYTPVDEISQCISMFPRSNLDQPDEFSIREAFSFCPTCSSIPGCAFCTSTLECKNADDTCDGIKVTNSTDCQIAKCQLFDTCSTCASNSCVWHAETRKCHYHILNDTSSRVVSDPILCNLQDKISQVRDGFGGAIDLQGTGFLNVNETGIFAKSPGLIEFVSPIPSSISMVSGGNFEQVSAANMTLVASRSISLIAGHSDDSIVSIQGRKMSLTTSTGDIHIGSSNSSFISIRSLNSISLKSGSIQIHAGLQRASDGGSISIQSGNATGQSRSGGDMKISSGSSLNSIGGKGGGNLILEGGFTSGPYASDTSGNVVIHGGSSEGLGASGGLFLSSGKNFQGSTGLISLSSASSGPSGVSGSVELKTGKSLAGSSGQLDLRTGDALEGSGGNIC